MEKFCIICGDLILKSNKRSKTCDKKECKKNLQKLISKQNNETKCFKHICNICNTEFIGRRNETVCGECKGKHVVKKYNKSGIQKITCKHCGNVIKEVYRKILQKNELSIGVCDDCKLKNKKNLVIE